MSIGISDRTKNQTEVDLKLSRFFLIVYGLNRVIHLSQKLQEVTSLHSQVKDKDQGSPSDIM